VSGQPIALDELAVDRAARLAQVMTADPEASGLGDEKWTTQDVVNVALLRGLDALELQYLPGGHPAS
jgi:hypothetical protein